MCCCNGSENEERIKRRMQRENQKHIKENNAGRDQQWKEGRKLGEYVYEQIQKGNHCYKKVEQNHQNTPNGFQYPTHSFYGQSMNMNTSLPSKSEIDNYYNNKEGAYIDQGNIYRNEGYSDTGNIFGKREQGYNNYIKEVAKLFNAKRKTKKKEENIQQDKSHITLNIYSGRNQNANGY